MRSESKQNATVLKLKNKITKGKDLTSTNKKRKSETINLEDHLEKTNQKFKDAVEEF